MIVSFLAVSYTTEAGAPGVDDAAAIVPPALTGSLTPIVAPNYGPTTIYFEPSIVLRQIEQAPSIDASVPDTLRAASAKTAPPPPQAPLGAPLLAESGQIENVNITFYDCANQGFCAHMYNGEQVYEGAAACSWNLPLGTSFYIPGDPTERIYVCKDRGLLDDTWVDIFWYHPEDGYNWQSFVGRYGTINIVYMP